MKFSFYIYKYLGPDKPFLLSFIQFPQVSNRYLISRGNATGDTNYAYLISSTNFYFFYFYSNEVDKRVLLFSLTFPKVLEWYFHYKKSYMGENKIDCLVIWPS